MHEMWKNYPLLAAELRQMQVIMKKSINVKDKRVERRILEMMNQGGKLLRPAYQLLFSRFGVSEDFDKKIALAASVEMLHTATLIHDDIVDEATTRRGVLTLSKEFGNDVAVYAGDFLFICVFKILSQQVSSLRSMSTHSQSIEKILNGEMGQMSCRYNLEMTQEEYIENISGKTAELFAMSCSIGAYESGCDELFSKKVYEIGKNIGIAFQIMDDYLDYTEEVSTIGKPVLEDMKQGVYSLPLLLALKKRKIVLRTYLNKQKDMTDMDTKRVVEIMKQTDCLEETKHLAESYTKKAILAMQKLPNDELNTRETLIKVTQTILNRSN